MEFQTPEDTVPSELITEELARQLVGKPKATGAWRDGDPTGDRSFANLGTLLLESGKELSQVKLAFESWGTLNEDASNAVLVLHALTGDSHAVGKASK
jgi:homoserine O-acetyltransferase